MTTNFPTFTLTVASITCENTGNPNRPVFIHLPLTMTSSNGDVFEGNWAECFSLINSTCGTAEFIETCVAGVITLTPTGRLLEEVFVEDADCSLFFLDA